MRAIRAGELTEVAVVIVNYRTPDLAIRCIDALHGDKEVFPRLRVVLVDGGSADDSAAQLFDYVDQYRRDWISFLPLETNGGFGWANNQAILVLSGEPEPPEFIYLLNPDAEVTGGAVATLVDELQDFPDCGAVGSQLLASDGCKSASAFRFPSPGRELIGAAQSEKLGKMLGINSTVVSSNSSCEVDWVTGASVMFRAEALRQSGLFDDGFFLYFEEVELMHRLREHGWKIRYAPESRVSHIEGASTGIGAMATERPHPRYWYDSRRRYFGLTGGRSAVIAANLSLLAGKGLRALKAVFRRSPTQACRTKDVFRYGFVPSSADVVPSFPAWGDQPGRPPAWMDRT